MQTIGWRFLALGAALFASGAAPAQQPATPAAPAAPAVNVCASKEHGQFDFWVGDWEVFRDDTEAKVARSKVERLYDGCVLRENWMPFKGTPGGSLNVYRPGAHEWRQVWTDQANELHDYHGRWTGELMEFVGTATAPDNVARKVRMTFQPGGDGSVVQTGFNWSEKDQAWTIDYRFTYRRSAG